MITSLRMLGEDEFYEVTHDSSDCPFCLAAKTDGHVGLLFLENGKGEIRRVEWGRIFGAQVIVCETVTREEAEQELRGCGLP